jgi:hypothetical protein
VIADCKNGIVKRRSPKNFGWSRGLFDGPGGLADRATTLESFISKEVEGPAATALRTLTQREPRQFPAVPPELGRYLAWAAARSLSMKALFQRWIDALPALGEVQFAEPPPPGFGEWSEISHAHRMEHPVHGVREEVPCELVELLRNQGWRLCWGSDDFLGLVHLQAWYFQVRFFPRLKWLSLRAPAGRYFIIGDRPVVWGFDGHSDIAPYALRNPLVQLAARATGGNADRPTQADVVLPGCAWLAYTVGAGSAVVASVYLSLPFIAPAALLVLTTVDLLVTRPFEDT